VLTEQFPPRCLSPFPCRPPAVINRETSVKASVAQELVERDLDFLPPPPRDEGAGRYYAPMMRISIIQLQLITRALRDLVVKVRSCPTRLSSLVKHTRTVQCDQPPLRGLRVSLFDLDPIRPAAILHRE
jgi:hypothetical protein